MTNSKFWYEVRKKIQEVLEQEKAMGIKRDIENDDDDSDDIIVNNTGADSEVISIFFMLFLKIIIISLNYNPLLG